MKRNTIFNGFLAFAVACTVCSCYDLDEMSHNPYEIEDNTGAGGDKDNTDEDNTKYADVNINFTVSKEDSAAHLRWDEAWIGDKDEIFPPAKMWAYWQSIGLGTGFESYHYPFADPNIVLRQLGD